MAIMTRSTTPLQTDIEVFIRRAADVQEQMRAIYEDDGLLVERAFQPDATQLARDILQKRKSLEEEAVSICLRVSETASPAIFALGKDVEKYMAGAGAACRFTAMQIYVAAQMKAVDGFLSKMEVLVEGHQSEKNCQDTIRDLFERIFPLLGDVQDFMRETEVGLVDCQIADLNGLRNEVIGLQAELLEMGILDGADRDIAPF